METKKKNKEELVKKETKKLSKIGEWMRSGKPGLGEIVDMKAVLK
jgi:hypothetical protein